MSVRENPIAVREAPQKRALSEVKGQRLLLQATNAARVRTTYLLDGIEQSLWRVGCEHRCLGIEFTVIPALPGDRDQRARWAGLLDQSTNSFAFSLGRE